MSQAQSKAQETVNPHNNLLRQMSQGEETGRGVLGLFQVPRIGVRIQTQGCLSHSLGFFHSALVTSRKGHSPGIIAGDESVLGGVPGGLDR